MKGITGWAFYRDGDCLVTNAPQRWRCGMIEHAIAIINLVAAIAQLIRVSVKVLSQYQLVKHKSL
jgi:hypothetical protein